jgi:hypothetical protein
MSKLTRLEDIKVSDLQPTKFGIDLMADTIAEGVKTGVADPLPIAVKMTALETLAKAVREKIQPDVLEALGWHPNGKAEILGANMAQADTIRYDYSHIPEWVELDAKIKELTEKRKEIEETEKKYRRGELPVLSASTTFKITLAK